LKDERSYLLHIRDAIDRVLDYTKGGRDAFLAESIIQDTRLWRSPHGVLTSDLELPPHGPEEVREALERARR
jgi:hypothetical protein